MAAARADDGLSHHALIHGDQREYLLHIADFVRAGLAGGEPVLVSVPGHRDQMVRDRLGRESGVTYADMTETGRNPARIIPQLRTFADAHPGQRVRFVAEPAWPGRSAAELREVTRHEALVNLAFAGTQASILCLYDGDALGRSVIGGARCTHPAVFAGGMLQPSAGYAGPQNMPAECERALPPPPARAEAVSYRTGLRPIRSLVERRAGRSGLSGDRTASLVLAVSELAANTLRHTSTGGMVHVWDTPEEILCQVRDHGWIADPLAGRTRRDAVESGHGLWLVNQLCDLVELRTGQAGTTVRLHMRRLRDGAL
ncbi:MAG TPA: sensor histidine kinase [Streptosporangiaceae bacterium]|jgi:anti-sigma regulatory factor (Ser/Thr protein kinase)